MKRASSSKKKSRSAWVELAGERAMEGTAGSRKRRKEAASHVTERSPEILVLRLPKAAVYGGRRDGWQGNPTYDHDKGDVVTVKESKNKKETKLLAKHDVNQNDQTPQSTERRNNDIYPASSDSLNSNIPGQYDKGSAKKRQLSSASKKETQILVKRDVTRNDQTPQHIERSNAVLGVPGQQDKVSIKRRLISSSNKQKNQDIVMDLIKQNVLENERLRQKFQQHDEKRNK